MKKTPPKIEPMWIVSAHSATTDYGTAGTSYKSLVFKEAIDPDLLKHMISDFTQSISSILDGIEDSGKPFRLDSIEVGAVMAADGKLGILGSSIGGKAEGALRFTFNRVL